jgi:diguanylate cyclase (GGDEF)-like protein
LTDLPNRSLFLDRLNQNLKQSKRYGRKFALLFIDLDGFKSVNDTLGHDAGDELLKKTGKRIVDCVREADTVARIGGDEFTVILSSITSVDDAQTVAQKIINTLSTPFKIKDQEAQIGASIGISAYPDNGMDAEILLKNADDAMYRAKNSGKNDYRLSPC